MSGRSTDVLVVGAGFAGLSAALALKEQGRTVLVLEARDRVGGRVETTTSRLGEMVEPGGQFFCEDMPEVMALARRYEMDLIAPSFEGSVVERPPTGLPPGSIFSRSSALRERMNAADLADPAINRLTAAE